MKEFDSKSIVRMTEVPLRVEESGEPAGVSVVLVEDANGTRSFWYEREDGAFSIPDYTDEEWELFDNLLVHVGWEEAYNG